MPEKEGLRVRNDYREHFFTAAGATIPAKTEDVRVRAVQESATHGIFPALRASGEKKRSGCTGNPVVYLFKGVTFGLGRQAEFGLLGAFGRSVSPRLWGNEPQGRICLRREWHCRMAGKDLRRGAESARISLGANRRRSVPAEFEKNPHAVRARPIDLSLRPSLV
ncbi:MAG TPA: hypothetical protein VMV10_12955 [Pirellulales bacterium]|nr:hypothetical protein [Pirellulales bacterium]